MMGLVFALRPPNRSLLLVRQPLSLNDILARQTGISDRAEERRPPRCVVQVDHRLLVVLIEALCAVIAARLLRLLRPTSS